MTLVDFLRKTLGLKKTVYLCGRCGRPLVGEDSIARGFGPDCWKIVRDQYITKEDVVALAEDPLPAPGFSLDSESGELMRIEEVD